MPKDLSIEYDDQYDWWCLYEFGVYPRSSVLAGQVMKSYKKHYNTLEEAVAENPTASTGFRDANNTFDHLPSEEMDAYEEEIWWDRQQSMARY